MTEIERLLDDFTAGARNEEAQTARRTHRSTSRGPRPSHDLHGQVYWGDVDVSETR